MVVLERNRMNTINILGTEYILEQDESIIDKDCDGLCAEYSKKYQSDLFRKCCVKIVLIRKGKSVTMKCLDTKSFMLLFLKAVLMIIATMNSL